MEESVCACLCDRERKKEREKERCREKQWRGKRGEVEEAEK